MRKKNCIPCGSKIYFNGSDFGELVVNENLNDRLAISEVTIF